MDSSGVNQSTVQLKWILACAATLLGLGIVSVAARSGDTIGTARPAPTTQLESSQAAPMVLDARIGEHPDKTRFVIETSDPLTVRVFTLTGPDRVVVDLPQVVWRLTSAQRPSGRGAVRSYRYGQFRPGNSRLVIDLVRPVSVASPMVIPPGNGNGYRLVLDLVPTTQEKFTQAAGWPADLRAKEEAAEGPTSNRRLESDDTGTVRAASVSAHIIVLDAGHGGIDSGTIGVDGATEKDLVFDEVLRLRGMLRQRGYTVFLTRDGDTYIPLGQRVNIARADRADLFISLHADSNPDPGVSGASVYTLSESGSDREAAALARKENQSDVIAGVDLSGQNSPVASILIDLAQRDTMNRSARLAQNLISSLQSATDVLTRDPHRSAGFVVLKSPDVPAVLVELGYLSNPRDCAQMRTTEWRSRVARAIADAVDHQFRGDIPAPAATEAAD